MAKLSKAAVRSIRVEQLAPNQNIIIADGNQMLQSHNSRVAVKYADGKVELGAEWDYSNTTMQFVKQFLDSSAADTRKKIASEEWKLNLDL